MREYRNGVLGAMLVLTSACSHFGGRSESLQDREDRETIARIVTSREAGQGPQACEQVHRFLQSRGHSSYLQAARLEEGRCLEDAGKPAEAAVIYRDVRDKTMDVEPRLPAQAEWRLSFTAEAEGEDLKALSHLLGAEKRREMLSEKTSKAELPARKALLLRKLGRDDDAALAVQTADRGLRDLLAGPRAKPDDEWMANLYLEMGRSLTRNVDADHFSGFLKAQLGSQVYLIKAMSYGGTSAAPKALEILRANYAEFWNFIRSVPAGAPEGDPVLAARMRREQQIPLLSEFLKVIEEARNLRVETGDENRFEKDFRSLTEDLSVKARRVLFASPASTILTEESRLLNGLRRNVELTSPPSAPPLKSDPNL